MSAFAVEHRPQGGDDWDRLVRFWEEMDWPEGCKVEIIGGIITVAPPPVNAHNYIAERVHRRLYSVVPDDWGVYETLNVAVPSKSGIYIPDLAVAPHGVLLGGDDFVAAEAAELAVEVTSKSNAVNDRVAKLNGYAAAGVPLYLLIDPHAPGGPTIHLYGEPQGGVYRVLWAGKFGETVKLPEPFNLDIDTSDFPVP
ncbi:Uma2 family endonuclease [Streptomyces sp. NPDC093225]|uniref:Uma2 family endonuclease n=1 Tax=Streptomyces sp. NPDC093225 TaxID=3366034 RepID=UPI00382DA5B9